MIIDERTKSILTNMVIDGNTTTITESLDRKEYVKINEVLQTLGGTWNKKQKCHVWTCSPSDALKVVIGSGSSGTITTTLETKKEIRKQFQCFFTPDALADRMVELAEVKQSDWILEPSAGNGQIIRAIQRVLPQKSVTCYELLEENCQELYKIKGAELMAKDFFSLHKIVKYDGNNRPIPKAGFDKILMNPPFSKHQDIAHVQHAHQFLADGGRLVAIMSCHPFWASHKIDVAFREWIEEVGATVEDIPSGEFSESGTEISTKLVVIDK